MDMSSLANVNSITRAPGAVTTYDERGDRVITNASLKNGNGTPVAAYSLIQGTTPYNPNNAYRTTIDRWAKAKAQGNKETGADIRIVRELLKSHGYDVDGMTDDEVMAVYLNDIQKNTYNMSSLNRVTGRASTVGAYKKMTGQFGATKR